ncbi:saccharopine dehydrogenase NADP-binding domain-containing protein [bacterium]|nr:saccharopine dehydrogenase NADP-binding domain-containing protein [bacterium]
MKLKTKTILILGAGQSTSALIAYLLNHAEEQDWFIIVADRDESLVKQRLNGHPRSQGVRLDVNDAATRTALIAKSAVVINMLTRPFQQMIAVDCLSNGAHMLSASYEDPKVRALDTEAHRRNLAIINELGLDPGIDHMSGMSLINRVHTNGGIITSFKSYGSGLPAQELDTNPLRYVITWNPRNVLMAGEDGAVYKENGKVKMLPFHQLFQRTWSVDIEGLGSFEAYPNRDSLSYEAALGLAKVKTIIRGTLRFPGWSETWQQVVFLGLANESLHMARLNEMTYRDMTEMFVPADVGGTSLEQRVANHLGINPTGRIMSNLKWLGLFSRDVIGIDANTVADVMIHLIKNKLRMPAKGRDMVILRHELEVEYRDPKLRKELITSTMVDYGIANGETAIAKTVGLPVAITAKLLLTGKIPLRGCQIPTHPAIYEPVLRELEIQGIKFDEVVTAL